MPGRFPSDHSRSPSQNYTPSPVDSMHNRTASSRSSNPNVFADEYSLEPIDSEQTTLTPRSGSVSSIASSNTLRGSVRQQQQLQQLQQQQKAYGTGIVPNESETTENPFGDEARVSMDEGNRTSLQKGLDVNNRDSVASSTPSVTNRSQSTSSRFSMPPRALSPYTGATGPSHPYAMYPQTGVSRSPSVTTTSTVRPMDRPLGDAHGPQHPYAMYTQNVVPEEGIDNPIIPLGFPGHEQAYQRPPGRADDDVGDLVGPDGHMEQLPPYSRYPDNAAPKIEGQFDSGNGAGVVAEEQSRDEPAAPEMSEVSSRTLVAADNAAAQHGSEPPGQAPAATGVMAFEEKLKKKGKKKACCGLPVWTLVLVGVVMLVGACIGGVIGGVLGARKAANEENEKGKGPHIVTVTETPKMDATPISTMPTNLKNLPTGHFVIPAHPNNQSKFCITDQDYNPSWSCMKSGSIPIEVDATDTERNITFEPAPLTPSFTYGAQAPYFAKPTQSLSVMMDSSDLSMGPALTFFSLFDKLVIVPQDTFSTSSLSSRSLPEGDVWANAFQRKQTSQIGDKPWFCWWNSTVMEFFLYINETTRDAEQSTSSALIQPTGGAEQKRDSSPSNYPRRIKMDEKRDYPGAHPPYCQQMQVLDNGSIQTVSPETLQIKEMEPTPTTTVGGPGSSTQTYTAKAEYESICYCASLTD